MSESLERSDLKRAAEIVATWPERLARVEDALRRIEAMMRPFIDTRGRMDPHGLSQDVATRSRHE